MIAMTPTDRRRVAEQVAAYVYAATIMGGVISLLYIAVMTDAAARAMGLRR